MVLNLNDNAPVFIPPSYHVTVVENGPVVSNVLRVSTTDADSGHPPRYQIISGHSMDAFGMDSRSGILSAKAFLDRETQKEYKLVVSAVDGSSPPLTGTATITVTVGDVNDNPSSPGTQDIVVNGYNGQYQRGAIGKVQAGDPDDADQFHCSNVSNDNPLAFSVSTDCVVTLENRGGSLSAGTVMLSVSVSDGIHPAVLRRVRIVVINVPTAAPTNSLTFRVASLASQLVQPAAQVQLKNALQEHTQTSAKGLYLLDIQGSSSGVSDVSFAAASDDNVFVQRDRLLVDLSENRTGFESKSGLQITSLPVDPCASEPCKNLATCEAVQSPQPTVRRTLSSQGLSLNLLHINHAYRCHCRVGTAGAHCEYATDACYSSPCQHGATCQPGPAGGHICVCANGSFACDKQNPTKLANPCLSSPCKNYGLCSSENGQAVCHCRKSYYGQFCQHSTFRPVDRCQGRPCGDKGSCTAGLDSYTCACDSSHAGQHCERRRLPNDNACASNPCLHGSTCTPQGSSYVCRCSAGFAGPRCSWPLDTCQCQPCQNGATCVSGRFGAYMCECTAGFTGKNCTSVRDPCYSQPCQNGGKCRRLTNAIGMATYTCSCLSPFYGAHCQHSLFPSHCLNNPCASGSTCTAGVAGFTCSCPLGRYGDRCYEPTPTRQSCSSNPCQHNSTCVPQNGGVGYRCVCSPGFTGDRCHDNINDCASRPCRGNASCRDAVNGYVCECPAGMHGELCQLPCPAGYGGPSCLTKLYNCQPGRCQHGGTCVESKNTSTGYECRCLPFHSGAHCDQKLSCASNPCLHGGTCTPKTIGYSCACPPGHTGPNCELTSVSVKAGGFRLFSSVQLQTTGSIRLRFATSATNGLLLYNTQLQNGSSVDFLALELSDGYVQAAFGLGHDSTTRLGVRSRERLNDAKWHTVKVSHVGQVSFCQVQKVFRNLKLSSRQGIKLG